MAFSPAKWACLLLLAASPAAALSCTGPDPRCLYAPSLVFSSNERWFPVDFRFDGDADISNNLGHYQADSAGEGLRTANQAPVVYVHVAPGDAAAGSRDARFTTIEYWYYYVNDPDHVHDWESVYVVLENGTPARMVDYQHFWNQVLPWEQVPRNGTHPVVVSQEGKHASYPGTTRGGIEVPGSNFILRGDGEFPTEPGGTWSCSFGCFARVDAPWCRERWGNLDDCTVSPLPPVEWAWAAGVGAVVAWGVRRLRGRRRTQR